MNNKEASLQLISERFHLLPEDAATWFSSTRWSAGRQVNREMLHNVLNTLYDLQIIDHKPDPASLVADVGVA